MNAPTPFTATVVGSPRIGPNRELMWAVEQYLAGKLDCAELESVAATIRRGTWESLAAAGLDSVPVNTFSYYDQMLDTAVLVRALPPRVAGVADELDRYFAAARGGTYDGAEICPLETARWFDTNYHYIVPEIGPETRFSLHPSKVLSELNEARALGIPARPAFVGPITFLALSKAVNGAGAPIGRLGELVGVYGELLQLLDDQGVDWVQLDEPVLATEMLDNAGELVEQTYGSLGQLTNRPGLFVATYFGELADALPALAGTPVEAIGVDLVAGGVSAVAAAPKLANKTVVAGIVDGRNIWRTELEAALATLASLLGSVGRLAVSTSCSTLHVPYTLDAENELDSALRSWLAFGGEKVTEVVALARGLVDGRDAIGAELAASNAATASRRSDPRLNNGRVRAQLSATTAAGARRGSADRRRAAQQHCLKLPPLPTTTVRPYPQTSEVAEAIAVQERLGLDVLAHGQPDGNDMVDYLAEQLDGFVVTAGGWVQSCGSGCIRPPILYGDVARPNPMTVDWITYPQSLTHKPVKGMFTGPVTMLASSFVRNDQPLGETAGQMALAIRDETVDLQAAGIAVIQVDEPALCDRLPLRADDKQAYLRWAVEAFRLATSGVADSTQLHTHLCDSGCGEVIDAITEFDADVTSIETARPYLAVLDDLNRVGFANGVGPGICDADSPRLPSVEEIATSLRAALKTVPAERLWVNMGCGRNTGKADEANAVLERLVAAAKQVRAEA